MTEIRGQKSGERNGRLRIYLRCCVLFVATSTSLQLVKTPSDELERAFDSLTYTGLERVGMQVNISIDKLISQVF